MIQKNTSTMQEVLLNLEVATDALKDASIELLSSDHDHAESLYPELWLLARHVNAINVMLTGRAGDSDFDVLSDIRDLSKNHKLAEGIAFDPPNNQVTED